MSKDVKVKFRYQHSNSIRFETINLTLSLNKELLMQNDRMNSVELIFVLQLAEILININAKLIKLIQNKRNILTKLVFNLN